MKRAVMLAGLVAAGLSAAGPVVLRDEVDAVPPGQWRYDLFVLKDQLPATVDCTFVVASPGRAHVELMTRDNLQALLRGQDYESLAKSDSGRLARQINFPGEFAVVVVNEEKKREARVALRLSLDFTHKPTPEARYLSPERRLAVILISFVGFLTIVTLSARKLLLAMRRQ